MAQGVKGTGKWSKYKRKPVEPVVAKRKYQHRGNSNTFSQVNVEPVVPTVHLERGSGGEYRYGVRAPGLTVASAREEAVRQFRLLEAAVVELKNTVHGLNGR